MEAELGLVPVLELGAECTVGIDPRTALLDEGNRSLTVLLVLLHEVCGSDGGGPRHALF